MIDNRLKKEKIRNEKLGKKGAGNSGKKRQVEKNKAKAGAGDSGKKKQVEKNKAEAGAGDSGKKKQMEKNKAGTGTGNGYKMEQGGKERIKKQHFDKQSNVKPNIERQSAEKQNSHSKKEYSSKCPVFRQCGGCQLLDMPYEKQLELKQKKLEKLLKPYCPISPIIGMKNPYHYRNKVHAVFDHDKKGNPISGIYEAKSHRVIPVDSCLLEDEKADEIIRTIRGMLKSFKIRTYDEDTGFGLLRHVLIRRGFSTGEIMVVLVTASPVFPSKNNFVKALRQKHPEITTIVQNINGRDTSMVLGNKEHVLYGKGYIEDLLCGFRFRISSKSFYQINPVQTEILYKKAVEAAGLTGKERVIDAYCGIGTIGIVTSQKAKEVIGVELNNDAVHDAINNAKINGVKNIRFYCNDAGRFMVSMAEKGEHVDVVFMDPPRSGSTEEFIDSLAVMKPDKVVYISCGPETLARDLEYFRKKGYEAKKGWGVDLFGFTEHVETVVLLSRAKE